MGDDSNTEPRDQPPMVAFHHARSPFEARIVAAVLEDAGIPAFVPGGQLNDEFAVSQRLMNVQSVAVHVPADRVDEARSALAAARSSGATLVEEDREPAPPSSPGARRGWVVAVLLAFLFVPVLVDWLDGRARLRQAERQLPLYEHAVEGDREVWRWRHNGSLATVAFDRDADGVAERIESHDREGRLVQRALDADQNGLAERIETIGSDGRITRIAQDRDQDGRFERIADQRTDGLTVEWIDDDGDDFFERLEIRRGEELVLAQEFRGAEGYRTPR